MLKLVNISQWSNYIKVHILGENESWNALKNTFLSFLTNMHDNPAITGSAKASKITLGLESVEYKLLLYLMEKCPTDRTLYHILTIKWARLNFGTSERKLYPWWPLLCHILGPMDFLCCWKTSFHILVVILTDIAIFHGFAHKILFFSKLDLDQWENLSQSCVLWHIAWHTSHEQSWSNKQGITKNTAKFLILTVFDNYPENVHP